MSQLNSRIGMGSLVVCLMLPLLGGCQGTGGSVGVDWGEPAPPPPESRPMPPAHAPAHGRRAQQREYRYYPRSGIYFDNGRGVYFYYSDGRWQVSAELPRRFRVRLGDYVTVEADVERPYRDYPKHRAKYPPGLRKKGPDHPGNKHRGYPGQDD
ncbi:hypothetical protein [Thiohalophilus sp.]|uniref:hypothetical protein n=1 Tax=Thiohalophilus sp. TaxID=3028392 RepID=UPI002ACD8314|nr:hypothetical protein [Thiohalophilus sp.]MDZ7660984.1 hypothetical protein [Thiohalophilus sp.]